METAVVIRGERIGTIQHPISTNLAEILTQAYIAAGQNSPGLEDFRAIVAILESDLRDHFSVLTIPEVYRAIYMGIRGEITQRTDINNANIYQWLKHWKHCTERMEQLKKAFDQGPLALPAKGEGAITEEEKWQSSVQHVLMAFEKYKTAKHFLDYGNVAYLFLEKIGLINYSIERKKEIYQEAKRAIGKEKRIAMSASVSASEARHAKIHLDELLSNNKHHDVVAESRRRALKEYFDNLIEMEEDFSELLTDTKEQKEL